MKGQSQGACVKLVRMKLVKFVMTKGHFACFSPPTNARGFMYGIEWRLKVILKVNPTTTLHVLGNIYIYICGSCFVFGQ